MRYGIKFVSLAFAATWMWISNNAAAIIASELPIMEVATDLKLDPSKTYGAIVIKSSNITIDGQGAWILGESQASSKDFRGTAISSEGFSNVTIKNINAKSWETALHVRNAVGWRVENCDFSDNFHDPDFGWGENGRRGGMVFESVHNSTLVHNRANRVWDACVLVNSNDNVVEGNDFAHASNTCLKLWTACRNTFRNNNFSYGIRIKPGEVHARDSTSVLIESGSNDNRFSANDCTHGGDGIFIRVLNGWCSTGNYFEDNDCSFANNNGFECWAPRNEFVRNRANHCSYGFWMGGSDHTRLIENEASFNGLSTGNHNSPHLPNDGHAGIVFMFDSSSHTLARGNVCQGNNGAGIALIGDLESNGEKWKAYHWIIQANELADNRWGIYAKNADWIVLADNRFHSNSEVDVKQDGNVTRLEQVNASNLQSLANRDLELEVGEGLIVVGPSVVKVGQQARWQVKRDTSKSDSNLGYDWDFGTGKLVNAAFLEHRFERIGFHRIGVNLLENGRYELGMKNVYVVDEVDELGTETNASAWQVADYHDRVRSEQQSSKASFELDSEDYLIGMLSMQVHVNPYAGSRVALTYPKPKDAIWSLDGKSKIVFWLKTINSDVTGWQGGPFIMLHRKKEVFYIEPQIGKDWMRSLEYSEAREGWRRFEIPLNGDEKWQTEGRLPTEVDSISLAFDSWGAPALRIWIDGLGIE